MQSAAPDCSCMWVALILPDSCWCPLCQAGFHLHVSFNSRNTRRIVYPSTMAAAEVVWIGLFHVLVVYLGYSSVVRKPSMPISLFLEASRISAELRPELCRYRWGREHKGGVADREADTSARTCCELDSVLSGIGWISFGYWHSYSQHVVKQSLQRIST